MIAEKISSKDFFCAGCSACANRCPVNAILMKEDEEGFYRPCVDKEKCTECGLCLNVCPELNYTEYNKEEPECYAVMADDETRAVSSSGGAFTVLANYFLGKGGYVAGAAFDSEWIVRHILIDSKEDLDKLKGSKYVQSFVSETLYKDIEKILNDDKYVLFSGTPCQVAGLKHYLNKDYKKLLTVDLICSKVPPQRVFHKFLSDNYDVSKIKDIQFRSKKFGWGCSTVKVMIGNKEEKSPYWFRMYLNSLSLQESCSHCKYASTKRQGDITIGDFWKIAEYKPSLDDKKGTSVILVNSLKGNAIFDATKPFYILMEKTSVQTAVRGNRVLSLPFAPHRNSSFFQRNLPKNDFNKLVQDSLSNAYNVGILNFWWNSNRGGILTCYALQETLKDLGYSPQVIKQIPVFSYEDYQKGISAHFAEKHLDVTEWYHSRVDMRKLNEQFSTFIVGSDQVWSHKLNHFLQDFYYLNFANLDKNKIACAASFGVPQPIPSITKIMVKYFLSRFNSISVREEFGVGLCEDDFDVDATLILDPVFLIDKQKYIELAKESLKTDQKYIAYYFVHPSVKKEAIIKQISEKLQLPLVDIKGKNYIEDWLYWIINADYVVADSFHASSFSIIFHKKFMFMRETDKDHRFFELIKLTGPRKQIVKISDFNIDNLDSYFADLDWEAIDKKIAEGKEKSISWLKQALTKRQKKYPENQEFLEAFYASFDDRLNQLEMKLYDLSTSKN